MKILRAVGMGIALVILNTLMGDVFQSFEGAAVSFFGLAHDLFEALRVVVNA